MTLVQFHAHGHLPESVILRTRQAAIGTSFVSVAVSGGLLAWFAFAALRPSPAGFLVLAAIGLLAGFLSGAITERSSFGFCGSFALAFWIGEIMAIGPEAGLGHTVWQFIASLGALNFSPLLASLALPAGRTAVIPKRYHPLPSSRPH